MILLEFTNNIETSNTILANQKISYIIWKMHN